MITDDKTQEKYEKIVRRLDIAWHRALEESHEDFDRPGYMRDHHDLEVEREYFKNRGAEDNELFFVPEDWLYEDVLNLIGEEDVVVDMGAGDLRLSWLMAQKAKKVYAVEISPVIISYALKAIGIMDMPSNLDVIMANMFDYELPSEVTKIVVLVKNIRRAFPDSWHRKSIFRASMDGNQILGMFPVPKSAVEKIKKERMERIQNE